MDGRIKSGHDSEGWKPGIEKDECVSMNLKRIVIFVSDLDKQAAYYRDCLGLPVLEERKGWVEFDAGGCSIALHRGTRKPRLDFVTAEPLDRLHGDLKARGVKLREIKEDFLDRGHYCRGNDAEGNPFQISTGY
jgi:catechol 2,3-dioxygenase-like lactoylglutathione lyase family enzyme